MSFFSRLAKHNGAFDAIISTHWAKGSFGAKELALAVKRACNAPSDFKFLYGLQDSIVTKMEIIAKKIYGACSIELSEEAKEAIENLEKNGYQKLPICMAKTHLSLSDDSDIKGAPTGFTITVRDIKASIGAGFLYPLIGKITTMPGLPTRPCFYDIDVDLKTNDVYGLI